MSLRRARSPLAPKITIAHDGAAAEGMMASNTNPRAGRRKGHRCNSVSGFRIVHMSAYALTIRNRSYAFADLREVMAKATPARSGDELAGVAASSAAERVAARYVLAD